MSKHYLEAAWYFGGWSTELKAGEAKELRLAGIDFAVYRSESGALAAIGNRCPHRFAPLHLGKVKGEVLECGYHGLQFDARGKCAFNPHAKEGRATRAVSVPFFSIVEKYGAIWIWLAKHVEPDPSLIPDFSALSTLPGTAMAPVRTMTVQANYELLIDNLLDPTHAEFLHAGVLAGNGILLGSVPTIQAGSHVIEHSWPFDGVIAVPVLRSYMPDVEDVDTWLTIRWFAPGYVVVEAGIKPAEAPRSEGRFHAIYHICMPADENTSTYDVMTTRNFDFDDAELTEKTVSSLGFAFNHQDKPMIEAQQMMMGNADFWDLKPALFASDAPGIRVRRAMLALMNETQPTAA